MATEACGGGTPDLGSVLEVWGYIRGVGVGNKSGGYTRQPRGRGLPSTLVVASGLFWSIFDAPWASSGPKISSVKFQVNWTLFVFLFCETQKQGKTETGTGL